MNETASLAEVDNRDRVMISTESQRARRVGMLALVGAFGLLIVLLARNHYGPDWYTSRRLTGSL